MKKVQLETTLGSITLELNDEKAPLTVANFLAYVKNGHYINTIFHRVIKGFMIQGGGLTADMNQKIAGAPVKNEAANGLSNARGTIAMARTPIVDSATSQFFINTVDNTFLDHRDNTPNGYGYCVFGKVIEGMDVVDKIEKVETTFKGGHDDVPTEIIAIIRAVELD